MENHPDVTDRSYISKEDYLKSRESWRKAYKVMSKHIRELKIATAMMAKGGYSAACRVQSIRALMSNQAYYMMLDLENLKKDANFSVLFRRFVETTNFKA